MKRIQDVRLDYHNVQYLYSDGDLFYFMDMDTFEQPAIQKDVIGDASVFLKEGVEVKLTLYDNEPLDVELPTTVDLLVTKAENAVRGDTATGVTKKVVLETGAEVNTPNFVERGRFNSGGHSYWGLRYPRTGIKIQNPPHGGFFI